MTVADVLKYLVAPIVVAMVLAVVQPLGLGDWVRGRLQRDAGRPLRRITPALLDAPAPSVRTPVRDRPVVIRWALLVMALFGFGYGVGYPILAGGVRDWTAVTYLLSGNVVGVFTLARAVNVDPHRLRHDAFSRHRRCTELGLLADPQELLADLQTLLERLRFSVDWLEYEPQSGLLAINARRVRLILGWPQLVVVYGELTAGHPSRLVVLVDSVIPRRRDFSDNETTLGRIVQHFARAPASTA